MKQRPSPKKLAPRELAKAAKFLARITPIPFMEASVFKTFWRARLMPMVTLEFFIFENDPFIPSIKTLPRVLLLYRTDEYCDAWHVPGGFLGTNETGTQAIRRILRRELGVLPRTVQPLFILNHPRGMRDHHVSIFVALTLAKAPRIDKGSLEYFDPKKLPAKIIPYYRKAFVHLKKIHSISRTLSKSQKQKFFETLGICEISGR